MSPERNRHAWPNPRQASAHDPPVDNVKREVAGADQVDCGDGEAFEVVSAASGVLRVRLIGLVPSAFITQTSKSPSRLDVNAMRVPSGACCSSHVRFSGSAAWPAFRA